MGIAFAPPRRAAGRGNRNISNFGEFGFGTSQDARHVMNSLSAGDAFLMVAIMSVTFLIEIGFFILIGMF
jgi:hypothetical protein